MNFGANAGRTAAVFSKYPGLILRASVISFILSILSLGILLPALSAGMGRIFLKLGEGKAASAGDLFVYTNKTLQFFVLSLIIFLAASAAVIFIFLPVVVIAFWMYAVFFMAYENSGMRGSLSLSARAAVKNGLFSHIMAALVLCILNSAGILMFGLGLIFTFPLTIGFLVFSFEDVGGQSQK
jgi:hypothetical protein